MMSLKTHQESVYIDLPSWPDGRLSLCDSGVGLIRCSLSGNTLFVHGIQVYTSLCVNLHVHKYLHEGTLKDLLFTRR